MGDLQEGLMGFWNTQETFVRDLKACVPRFVEPHIGVKLRPTRVLPGANLM